MRSTTIFASFAAAASAACTRDFLQAAASQYVATQTLGQNSSAFALANINTTYTENAKAVPIKAGVISQPIKIDFTRSTYDTLQCATFTEIIAATNPHPYVIHTRMIFSNASASTIPQASLIESIVTDKGDWLFNATGTLNLNAGESWDPIPASKRDTRAAIQAVGDAYFNRFGNTSVIVPWGPPCYRLEGGLRASGTLNGSDCIQEWPSTIHMPYRRYVVDEEYGTVDIFTGFPGLDRTQGDNPMPDSHSFKIESGKIKYLHTASACVVEGCGLNTTVAGVSRRWRAGARQPPVLA